MTTDSDGAFKITVEGDGLSITREIDASALRRVLHVILGGNDVPEASPDGGAVGAQDSSSRPEVSLREYLTASGAKRHPDRIVAIGHYIEVHEGRAGFSRDDIKARFRSAGEAPPGNFPRDFAIALKSGWIAQDAKNPGQLYVTRSGQAAIEDHFNGAPKQARTKLRRRRPLPNGYLRS